MNYEEIMTQLILHGGNARGASYEALDEAEEYHFDKARELMEEANDEFVKGHKYQTQLIQSQDDKAVPSFVMIHAQDHIMTAQAEMQLIKRMIKQLQIIQRLEEKISD